MVVHTLCQLKPKNVLVVGDFMLDTYTIGKVGRISPEAPVPVLAIERQEHLPGGAGNVALNLRSLGCLVRVLGRIGSDPEGKTLATFLTDEGIDTRALVVERSYETPVKNRLIGSGQQIVRLDREKLTPLSEALEEEIVRSLDLSDIEIIAISDYGKGFLTRTLLSKLIKEAKKKSIPVIVDPKGDDFSKYRGATLIKPNLKEAKEASTLPETATLDRVAQNLLEITSAEMVMITRSQDGISLFSPNQERLDSPVKIKEILDVTGAGDTVLATITLGLACDIDLPDLLSLANLAAGIAIEHVGCVRVTLSDLASRLLELESKHYSFKQIEVLQSALKDTPYSLFEIEGPFTPETFTKLCAHKKENEKLIVYAKDADLALIQLLEALSQVDVIVHDEQSFCALIPIKL